MKYVVYVDLSVKTVVTIIESWKNKNIDGFYTTFKPRICPNIFSNFMIDWLLPNVQQAALQ
jgi:hypothetical protein